MEGPESASRLSRVAASLLPDLGLGSWPARRARITPAAVALEQDGRRLTYAELAARVETLAGGLAACGVDRGARVAYLGLNDILTFETMFATHRLGAVFVPLNHRLAPPEVGYALADSGAVVLVVGPGVEPLVTQLQAVGLLDGLCVTDAPRPGEALVLPRRGEGLELPVAVALEDPALFLYTSGTTGRPKAAVLTHANLTWNTVNQLAHVDILSSDHALCISPLFHAVGLGQITLPVLFKGGTVEVFAKFDAGAVLALIEGHRISSFSCVPTMLQLMCEHPAWGDTDLSSLRHVVYGGSPVTAHVAAAWWERGVQLQQGYGMTEASPGVSMAPVGGAREHPVSVGVAHFFTDVAFLDDAGLAPVTGGRRGELAVRGPHVFAGYWQRDDDTAAAVIEDATGRWYRTGDVLEAGQDGWLQVVDRVKDLIISGGENIYPAEVEAVLVELPQVRAAAVVARPHPRWGEVGVAYVETHVGQSLTADEVTAHLEPRLARYKLPREVVVVGDLPRNATGKVLRTELRSDAAQRHSPEGTSR